MSVTLETDRLILRPPVKEDLDGYAELMGDEQSARYLGGVQLRPAAWRGLASVAGSWSLLGFGMFSVVEKASGACIGRIGPWRPEGWPGTEVGWGIVRSAWGKGYATEAAIACVDWSFDVLGWSEVIHTIDSANAASKAVARGLGSSFMRMDRLPPPFDIELEVWGQTREQWRARAQAAKR